MQAIHHIIIIPDSSEPLNLENVEMNGKNYKKFTTSRIRKAF